MRRLPTLVSALLSVIATTVVLAPSPANASPTQPASAAIPAAAPGPVSAGCPKFIFIGARGSGESDTSTFHGMGPEVDTLFQAMKSNLPVGQTRSLAVVYTAKDAGTLELTKGEKKTLKAGARYGPGGLATAFAGVALVYKFNQLDPFVASINEGIASALDELTTMATQCPDARFVLAGYSQGAMVMHKMLLRLTDQGNSALLNRVVATALIADGDKKKETAAIRFGSSGFGAEGIRSALTVGERDVATPSSTYDICNAGDLVCDFTLQSLLDFNKAKMIHENSYKDSQLIRNIGKSIAADLLAVPLAVATASLPAGTQGMGYSTILSSTGGTAPFTWSVASGSLPPGLSLSAAGTISGTPSTLGSFSFVVAVHDSALASAHAALSLNVISGGGSGEVIGISAGDFHSCAVTTGGAVKCWGDNTGGELGNGTTTNSTTPVDVVGLGSGVATVAGGQSHSCAVTSGGAVKCWGYNGYGQLGNGTTTDSTTPVDVVGLGSGVAAVSLGAGHTCAVTTSGAVKCWGNNSWGELGNGTTAASTTPVDVAGLGSGVAAISIGGMSSCAVTTSGAVKCWGYNAVGELGNGTTTDSTTPVDVAGLSSGVVVVSTGYHHSCAVTIAGAVKCWGLNTYGALGNGTTTDSTTPVDVAGLSSGVMAVSAGGPHSCAVTTSGAVKCWGLNLAGQLGNGTMTDSTTPVDVAGLSSGVVVVSAGYHHSCAATTSGAAKCWGSNANGELGDGTPNFSATPVGVIGLP